MLYHFENGFITKISQDKAKELQDNNAINWQDQALIHTNNLQSVNDIVKDWLENDLQPSNYIINENLQLYCLA